MPKRKGKEPRSNHLSGLGVYQAAQAVPGNWDWAEQPTVNPADLHTGYTANPEEAYHMQGTDPGASASDFNYHYPGGSAVTFDYDQAAVSVSTPVLNSLALHELREGSQAAGHFGDNELDAYDASQYYEQPTTHQACPFHAARA